MTTATKRAIIITDPLVVVSGGLSVLHDHGLRLLRTLEARDFDRCAFLFEGEVLPDACLARTPPVVAPVITQDAYGQQRMRRVTQLTVTGQTAEDVLAPGVVLHTRDNVVPLRPQSQSVAPYGFPQVLMTGRDAADPHALYVVMKAVPTDDELRTFDDIIKGRHPCHRIDGNGYGTAAVDVVRDVIAAAPALSETVTVETVTVET